MNYGIAALCVAAALTTAASADLIIDEASELALDITASAGEGTNTSYLVIDFSATGGSSIALSYSWDDPESTVLDMMNAFNYSGGLELQLTFYESAGYFVDNFSWDDTGVGDASLYWASSLATPDGSGDVNWIDGFNSIDAEPLTDGLISGWYNGFTDSFGVIPPSLPLIAVPAPAALTALVAMVGLAGPRRRRA